MRGTSHRACSQVASLALSLATGCRSLLGFEDVSAGAPGDAATDVATDIATDSGAAFDEDNDGVPDAEDNCPQIANNDQSDMDADQVGDACDLHPFNSGDLLVHFEGFHGALPADWMLIGAPATEFTIVDDALVIASTADVNKLVGFDTGGNHHAVEAKFTVATGSNGQQSQHASLLAGATQPLDVGMSCSLFPEVDRRELTTYVGANANTRVSSAVVIDIPGTFTMTAMVEDAKVRCAYEGSAQEFSTIATSQTYAGLAIRNVEVRIEWVAVYRFP